MIRLLIIISDGNISFFENISHCHINAEGAFIISLEFASLISVSVEHFAGHLHRNQIQRASHTIETRTKSIPSNSFGHLFFNQSFEE